MKFRITFFSGLMAAIAIFMLFIISFLIFSVMQPNRLVSGDYYSEDLAYQQRIDQIYRTGKLSNLPTFQYVPDEGVKLTFPNPWMAGELTGLLHLYKPSDAKLDLKYKLQLDRNGEQSIQIPILMQGLWQVKLSWQMESKSYYFEDSFVVR